MCAGEQALGSPRAPPHLGQVPICTQHSWILYANIGPFKCIRQVFLKREWEKRGEWLFII